MKKSIFPIVLLFLISFLCGCNNITEAVYRNDEINYLGETIMQSIINDDFDTINNLFCKRSQSTHDLKNEFKQLRKLLDGNIISYEKPDGYVSNTSYQDGKMIEQGLDVSIVDIKSDKNKSFRINFWASSIHDEEPDLVGVSQINLIWEDEFTQENNYPDDAICIMGELFF